MDEADDEIEETRILQAEIERQKQTLLLKREFVDLKRQELKLDAEKPLLQKAATVIHIVIRFSWYKM